MGVAKGAKGGIQAGRQGRGAARRRAGTVPQQTRRGTDRLSDAACRAARADDGTIRKFSDGKGLYLAVMPTGAKLWRLKYRHSGKEGIYSIGPYDEVSLADARKARDEAREWMRQGKDPVDERRAVKNANKTKQENTFEAVAREFIAAQEYSAPHRVAVVGRLEKELMPDLGPLPLDAIGAPLVLATLKKIEARGALETASKCRVLASQVFRHAIVTGRLQVDPAAHLSKAMQSRAPINRATIPLADMPSLFAALAKVPAEANTRLALIWLILSATRTGETRFATWGEIDAKAKIWRIPPERMKMRDPHQVPLSTQAQHVLELAAQLRHSDAPDALLFPGFTRAGHLSENALLALLARAGFFGRQTTHGFRASFSTWAHEVIQADPDVVEACLAHVRGDVRAIYNRSTYLSRRRELLQAWADQCEAWGMQL